jgi:hypothetical protein
MGGRNLQEQSARWAASARRAWSARRRRSSGGRVPSGSRSFSNRLRNASRAGCVRALRSCVRLHRCRFPAEYKLANRVEHPLSVYLREAVVIGQVDEWLAREFTPHRMTETLDALAATRLAATTTASDHDETIRRTSPEPRRPRRQVRNLPAARPQTDVLPRKATSGSPDQTHCIWVLRECPRPKAYQSGMIMKSR